MKRKGFPSALRDVRTRLHVISNFISLWFTPLATAHPLPLAFEVLGFIHFYFFPLTPGTAKLALLGSHPGEAGTKSSKAPSPARLCQTCQLCPAPFSAPPIPPPPPIFNHTITPQEPPTPQHMTCFFPPSAFTPSFFLFSWLLDHLNSFQLERNNLSSWPVTRKSFLDFSLILLFLLYNFFVLNLGFFLRPWTPMQTHVSHPYHPFTCQLSQEMLLTSGLISLSRSHPDYFGMTSLYSRQWFQLVTGNLPYAMGVLISKWKLKYSRENKPASFKALCYPWGAIRKVKEKKACSEFWYKD